MERKYLAFDIEIAKEIPQGAGDWKQFRPFGISCAATLCDGFDALLWHGAYELGKPADRMSDGEVAELVHYLDSKVRRGYTIVGWNSLGFDFDVLAEESGLFEECADLAVDHVDMMFHFFAAKGFAVGLDKACKGAGLLGKPAGMNGALAPGMWLRGQYKQVLDYVENDVRMTLQLAHILDQRRELCWTSQSGRLNTCAFPSGLLTVRQALALPLPDVASLSNPWPREKFTGWLRDRCPSVTIEHVHRWEAIEDAQHAGWYRIACQCGDVYSPRNLLRLLAKDAGEVVAL